MASQLWRREDLLTRLQEPREWDLAIIGGGAVGLGVALDAAVRGLSVVLLGADAQATFRDLARDAVLGG